MAYCEWCSNYESDPRSFAESKDGYVTIMVTSALNKARRMAWNGQCNEEAGTSRMVAKAAKAAAKEWDAWSKADCTCSQ